MLVLHAPELYPWILLGVVANAMFLNFIGIWAALQKGKYFTDDFMKQFEDEHRLHYPDDKIDGNGQPDNGSGWYAMKLPLKEWIGLNSSLRIHLNSMEQFPNVILTAPIAGIFMPEPTLAFTWGFVLFRILYWIGFQKHPNNRVVGFLGGMLCVLGLFICSFWSVAKMFEKDAAETPAPTPTPAGGAA